MNLFAIDMSYNVSRIESAAVIKKKSLQYSLNKPNRNVILLCFVLETSKCATLLYNQLLISDKILLNAQFTCVL